MAVVHRTVCAGGGVQQHIFPAARRVPSAVEDGAHWADGHAVFDRERTFAGDVEKGGTSSADAGSAIVGGGVGDVAVVDTAGMDPALGGRILLVFGIMLKQDAEKPERGDWDHDQAAEDANQGKFRLVRTQASQPLRVPSKSILLDCVPRRGSFSASETIEAQAVSASSTNLATEPVVGVHRPNENTGTGREAPSLMFSGASCRSTRSTGMAGRHHRIECHG